MDFCSPLGLVSHGFPLVESLEFRVSSPILVSLLFNLKNHGIIGSSLPARRFLIVDLIEHGHLLVCRWTSGLLYSLEFVDSSRRWCCCMCQLWHPRTSFQAWCCLQHNPQNASIKHEPEKLICKYNILVKRMTTK
jgi:hypothetical protein